MWSIALIDDTTVVNIITDCSKDIIAFDMCWILEGTISHKHRRGIDIIIQNIQISRQHLRRKTYVCACCGKCQYRWNDSTTICPIEWNDSNITKKDDRKESLSDLYALYQFCMKRTVQKHQEIFATIIRTHNIRRLALHQPLITKLLSTNPSWHSYPQYHPI